MVLLPVICYDIVQSANIITNEIHFWWLYIYLLYWSIFNCVDFSSQISFQLYCICRHHCHKVLKSIMLLLNIFWAEHTVKSWTFWVTRRGPWRLFKLEMNSEALQVAKVYRQLLKAVKNHIGKEENKKHFVDYVAQKFREKSTLSKPHSVQQKIKLARDYTFLLNSVHHQKDLLFSYNIAIDRSDEMKRILGKSAASVGLKLPEVYQPWCPVVVLSSRITSFLLRKEE